MHRKFSRGFLASVLTLSCALAAGPASAATLERLARKGFITAEECADLKDR